MADRSRHSERGRSRRSRPARLARRACESLRETTGSKAESVTALERSDDGTWKITVEVLELSRTPDTDDVIGSYETELDEEGELLGYRRLRRYPRNRLGLDEPDQGEQQSVDSAV
jgi:Gas vesicle synthesis protein GvpO